MEVAAEAYFDIKSLNLQANEDAGVLITGQSFAPCAIQYLTTTGVGIRVDTNRITTYGGAAFKTGICCGFLALKTFANSSFQDPIFVSPTHFDEIKVGTYSFFRFNFLQQEALTGFVHFPLSI